jgi:hypothetical protein
MSPHVPTSLEERVLRPDTLSPNIIKAEYGVRGEIYLEAQKMVNAGEDVVFMNVGNPHQLGQKPLTFPRQVSFSTRAAIEPHCCSFPELALQSAAHPCFSSGSLPTDLTLANKLLPCWQCFALSANLVVELKNELVDEKRSDGY